MSRSLITAFAFVLAAATAQAAPVAYTVDPVHSSVNFEIRHLFSKVRGSFKDYEGTIKYDAAKASDSSVTFSIKAASINTENAKRDGHLNSPDFFDTAKFKTIDFKSTKIVSAGGKKLKVTGDLTMHGVTKSVTFDSEVLGVGPGIDGKEVASFQGTTTVNRKDFGIIWNKVLDAGGTALGDDVKLDVLIEAGRADGAVAKAKTK